MSPQKTKYRWVILFMVYICMLVFAFTLQFLPPILPTIIANFQLSHTQAGLLMSLFTLPSIFLAIIAGLLSDRWGTYRCCDPDHCSGKNPFPVVPGPGSRFGDGNLQYGDACGFDYLFFDIRS
jgi:MFS family permease